MKKKPVRRAPLSDRVGLPAERLQLGHSRFVHKTRDLTILPESGDRPYPLIVAAHGMAMRAEIFARWLGDLMNEPWAWFLPEGPFPLERRVGHVRMIGHAWYLYDGNTPAFRHSMRQSEEHLLTTLTDRSTRRSFDPERTLLLGFSQGGYFVGSLGLRHAERFRGIAVVGGRIRPSIACRPLDTIPKIPILFIHGKDDDVVPADQARASADELRDHGFPVTWVEVEGEHRWNGAMSEAFREWARTLLGDEVESV